MKDEDAGRYIKSCQASFWHEIFRIEARYILSHLDESNEVLSIGCGPGHIERILCGSGIRITGVDISEQAIGAAPDDIRKVIGRAEEMSFPEGSFDAAIYVASLQFVEDYEKAIKKTALALKAEGIIIAMLLNPESNFYKQKKADPDSYISSIRHTDLKEIEDFISRYFDIGTEYLIGVKGTNIFSSQNPEEAVLYIIRGIKKKADVFYSGDNPDAN